MFYSKNIENLILWIIKIIIFIIPFLPLYISSSMPFPFITGKNFAFRILVELAAILWIGIIAVKKEYRIRNSPIVLSVMAFTFIVGLADLSGVDPTNSFWSNFERMEGYITILHIALYFMIIKSILRTKNDWKIFFSIVLLVSVFVSLYHFVFNLGDNSLAFRRQAIEYGTRIYSTIGNPPFLASYLLMSSFIGLILLFHVQKAYLRVGCLMAVVLNCVVIYLTATRGAILSAAAGVLIFVFVYIFRRSNESRFTKLKLTLILLSVMSVIIAGVFFIFSDAEFVRQDQTLSRFVSMLSSESVKSRIDVWGKALNALKERPFLGWGQENFIGVYSVNPIPLVREQIWLDRAHNSVIEWMTNSGILGLLSYLAIFGSAFFVLRNVSCAKVLSRGEAEIIFIALVVYFIQNLFTFDTINSYMIFFALLAYIDSLTIDDRMPCSGPEQTMDLKRIKIISLSVTLVALLCFSIVFYYVNYKPIKQARQIIRISFSSQKEDSYSMFLKDLNSALSINTIGDFYLRISMLAVSNKIILTRDFDQKGASKFIQSTVDELVKGIEARSYDLEYITHVIKFFKRIAVYEKRYVALTESLIKKCMNINPEYQWLNMVMADVKILKEDYEGAFNSVKSIAEPDPGNETKQFKLALMALYSSREETVKKALENVKKIRISEDKNILSVRKSFLSVVELYQLAQVHKDMKRYAATLHILEEIITTVSEEKLYFEQDLKYYRSRSRAQEIAQIHTEIAWIYLQLNDRLNAMKEFEKAVKIDPGLSENIKKLIDSINNEI